MITTTPSQATLVFPQGVSDDRVQADGIGRETHIPRYQATMPGHGPASINDDFHFAHLS